MKRAIGAVGAVAVATAIGVAVARATIPDATGVLHGCYALDGGTLRVIDPASGETCAAATEVPLDWNVPGARGSVGPAGPQGPQGVPGAQGAPGQDAASAGYEQVSASFTTDNNGNGIGEADCSNGKLAFGGGVSAQTQTFPVTSRPTNDGGGWAVTMRGSSGRSYTVYAICMVATSKGGGS